MIGSQTSTVQGLPSSHAPGAPGVQSCVGPASSARAAVAVRSTTSAAAVRMWLLGGAVLRHRLEEADDADDDRAVRDEVGAALLLRVLQRPDRDRETDDREDPV